MELTGKIIQVLEARGGTSPRTGNPWKVQSYVLEIEEQNNSQYPRRMVFDVFGEDRIQNMNIQMGQVLRVSFDIDAREYQGRWFNSIRAWKVEPADAMAAATTPGVNPTAQTMQTTPGEAPSAMTTPAMDSSASFESQPDSTDDLPF